MSGTIIQIYEIQTPGEACAMIGLGVDHVGSVITSQSDWQDPVIRDTVTLVRKMGAVSSLIPLYTDPDAIFETIDYYRPHIVHFCDALAANDDRSVNAAIKLQAATRHRFPDVKIMRSIPIRQAAGAIGEASLALAVKLEPLTDYFLTDTVISGGSDRADSDQPVEGFVGITGLTCDWSVAAQLVARSRIPVILAGGISPENVADGIRQVRPFGVDSCTCTNAVDGKGRPVRFKKDPARVGALVSETHNPNVGADKMRY